MRCGSVLGGRPGNPRAGGYPEPAVGGGEALGVAVEGLPDRRDGVVAGLLDGLGEPPRPRGLRGPPVRGRAEVDGEVERLDVVAREAGGRELLRDETLARPRELPGRVGRARLREAVV